MQTHLALEPHLEDLQAQSLRIQQGLCSTASCRPGCPADTADAPHNSSPASV